MSMDMASQRVRDQAGAAVMNMAFGQAKDQGAAVVELINSAVLPQITDPVLGTQVDLLA